MFIALNEKDGAAGVERGVRTEGKGRGVRARRAKRVVYETRARLYFGTGREFSKGSISNRVGQSLIE
jgi:hypothetical protein